MHVLRVRHIAIAAAVSTSVLSAGLPAQPPPQATPPAGQPPQQGAQPAQGQQPPRRPRPYAQVITNRAVTDAGGITVHRVDDRWFFEVPDSLVMRDFLFVTRVAGVPANFGGFTSAGTSLEERLVRFERNLERVVLRSLEVGAYADAFQETAQPRGRARQVAVEYRAEHGVASRVEAARPLQHHRKRERAGDAVRQPEAQRHLI